MRLAQSEAAAKMLWACNTVGGREERMEGVVNH